jgi:hypothetical protein
MMNSRLPLWSFVVALSALRAAASAQLAVPTCSDWKSGDRTAASCTCDGVVRTGDERAQACGSASAAHAAPAAAASAAPADKVAAAIAAAGSFDGTVPRKFGLLAVTADGGYITGADGSGAANGSIAVTFYRQKTKFGTFSADAELGRYRMGGIPINDSQSVGVVGQLPDGTPINGTVVTTGRSPAVDYIPLAAFKYQPLLRLGRVHPYAVVEAGISRLSSTNATVNSTLFASVGGQPVGSQNLGTSLQPTGEARNHAGGGFGGGTTVDITRRVALDTQFLDAPTGYKVFKTGITVVLGRQP